MVNYSLHRLAGDLLNTDPYSDGSLNDGLWDQATPEFKHLINEFTGLDVDTQAGQEAYIIILKQIILPILDAYPDIECLANITEWNKKTYKVSGIPTLTYDTIKKDIQVLLNNIKNSNDLRHFIYKSNRVLTYREETDEMRQLAIFLLLLIEASPIKVK